VQLGSADGPSFAVGVAALELLGDEDEEDEDQPSRRGICRLSHDFFPKWHRLALEMRKTLGNFLKQNMRHVTACDGT